MILRSLVPISTMSACVVGEQLALGKVADLIVADGRGAMRVRDPRRTTHGARRDACTARVSSTL
jgi:hypothetical protein